MAFYSQHLRCAPLFVQKTEQKQFLILQGIVLLSSWSIIVLCFGQNCWRCQRSSPYCLIQRTLQIFQVAINIKYYKWSWNAPKCVFCFVFYYKKYTLTNPLNQSVFCLLYLFLILSTLTCFNILYLNNDRWMLQFCCMTWQNMP